MKNKYEYEYLLFNVFSVKELNIVTEVLRTFRFV